METRRRVKLTVATPLVQVVTGVLLAITLGLAGRDYASGWGDLIGVVIGIVLGPSLGLAVMVVLVQRARSRSLAGSIGAGLVAACVATLATLAMLIVEIHFWVALGILCVLSTISVWVLAGRD